MVKTELPAIAQLGVMKVANCEFNVIEDAHQHGLHNFKPFWTIVTLIVLRIYGREFVDSFSS